MTPQLTDYERHEQRNRERAAEMRQLFADIAALMAKDGWTIQQPAPEDANNDYLRHVLVKGALKIHFGRSQGGAQDKVNIAAWQWPEYRYTESDYGKPVQRFQRITPSDLYDPKEASPGISCSIARGAEAIVKDLTRRFLPEYERIFARCQQKADANKAYADKARSNWEETCTVIGASPDRNNHSVKTALGDYNFRVENRNGYTRLEIDHVQPEQLAAIITALKPAQEAAEAQ